ncbi:MAG TPA: hypothetical protein PK778_09050 [Bacillota bacterium]|nr:hypothetical protein [Clostridiales bacterium]HPT86123.1 hypothetical protein [Bacillota bacterium]
MTWEIVAGLLTLCGTMVTLGTVLAKLVKTLTRLDVTLAALERAVGEDRRKNGAEHAEMRAKLESHEGRITRLEWRGVPKSF